MKKMTADESYEYDMKWLEQRIMYHERLLSEIEKRVGKDIITECTKAISEEDMKKEVADYEI